MHAHVRTWQRPAGFERHTWDFETVSRQAAALGQMARRNGAHRRNPRRRFGESAVSLNGALAGSARHQTVSTSSTATCGWPICSWTRRIKVIDFDDCGFSWFLYDCATTVSFFEDRPEVPELSKRGCGVIAGSAPLAAEEEAEIRTFVMLRRLLLVAWIGSHSEKTGRLLPSDGRRPRRKAPFPVSATCCASAKRAGAIPRATARPGRERPCFPGEFGRRRRSSPGR